MTMLINLSSHHGLVVAADSRLSWPESERRPPQDGHRRVFAWEAMVATIGFAGRATVRGRPVDKILEDLAHSQQWSTRDDYANAAARRLDELRSDQQPGERRIYVHVAGFGPVDGPQMPQFHYVTNADGPTVRDEFHANEDLRDTELVPRGIRTLDDYLDPLKTKFAKVQYSGERPEMHRRLGALFERDYVNMNDIEDVANWAGGKVRSVARARPGSVGGEGTVWKTSPDSVEQHPVDPVRPMPSWRPPG